jgi:hypothetical protein
MREEDTTMDNAAKKPRCLALTLALAGLAAPLFASFSVTDVFLPMVGRNPGIYPSQWYTTVWVYNPGDTAADVSFYLLERDKNNTAAAPYTDTIQPGDTRCYENALLTMFGKNAWGAIRVTSAQRVIVNERFYNQAPGMAEKDSQGQYFAGLPASFAIGLGERTDVIGIYQTTPASSSEFRYNYGFVEVTGKVVTVRLTPIDEAGTTLASPVNHQIQPLSQRQFAFKDDFPSVSTENARLAIEVVSGAGKVLTYGTGIANGSQDPTTFEMGFKAEALGIATVQHDSTLTGDGSAGAPLGLADGGVTAAKIDTTGAAHGQVIKAGSAAAWADDGLTLPFSGSSSDAAPAVSFAVANSSTGDGVQGSTVSSNGVSAGVRGVATDTFGVVGESTNWTGVYGSSTAGPGVHGKSTSGDGLVGESSGAGTSGVYAVNTNAAGYAGYFSGNVQVDGSFTCSACVSAGDLANGAVGKGKLRRLGAGARHDRVVAPVAERRADPAVHRLRVHRAGRIVDHAQRGWHGRQGCVGWIEQLVHHEHGRVGRLERLRGSCWEQSDRHRCLGWDDQRTRRVGGGQQLQRYRGRCGRDRFRCTLDGRPGGGRDRRSDWS